MKKGKSKKKEIVKLHLQILHTIQILAFWSVSLGHRHDLYELCLVQYCSIWSAVWSTCSHGHCCRACLLHCIHVSIESVGSVLVQIQQFIQTCPTDNSRPVVEHMWLSVFIRFFFWLICHPNKWLFQASAFFWQHKSRDKYYVFWDVSPTEKEASNLLDMVQIWNNNMHLVDRPLQ